ncbi:MAG: hypothetical protein H6726_09110 [Sandaracinaceae bacterium]|nr:hypothetical protein [Sandaracinaceae bacterium]
MRAPLYARGAAAAVAAALTPMRALAQSSPGPDGGVPASLEALHDAGPPIAAGATDAGLQLAHAAAAASHGADAASEAAGPGGTFTVVVGFLAVSICYLLADTVVERIQRRFLVLAGVQFLLLGYLLGPQVPWVPALNNLGSIFPVIALAAGWVGLLRGTQFDTEELRASTGATWSIVLLHHVLAGVLTGGVAYWLFMSGFVGEVDERSAKVCASVIACCAAADSAAPFELLGRRYLIQGHLAPLLSRAARFGDVLVIIVFSVVFAVFHGNSEGTGDAAEWWLITLGLGAGLGALFTPFMGADESENGRFLALVGIITFASGAAYFLRLSPLAVNVVLGIFLVNLSKSGRSIRATLQSTEKPMALVLMILAGALWKPSPWLPTLVGLAAFVALRLVGKWLGSWVGARGSDLRRDLYRGLLAHGSVTVAMVVSFRLVYERVFPNSVAIDIAYSVILGSVILNDLVAPRVLRALLVDAGDLDRELADSADADKDGDGIPDGEQDGMLSGIVPVGVAISLPRPPQLPRESARPHEDEDDDTEKDGY